MLNTENIKNSLLGFRNNKPFDHCIIDNFFEEDFAKKLSNEFPQYESKDWFFYKNAIENKKALNDWNLFPENTYKAFFLMQSYELLDLLSNVLEKKLLVDPGLHGGGWHIHGTGGNLNPHLDYSIHPKLSLQRKLNIIIYLSRELQPEIHGGHLGLWEHDERLNQPGKLKVEVEPIFNRAVIFDTTQMSWHGMSRPLNVPNSIFRKSLAIYYLIIPDQSAAKNFRALFAPREEQKNDKSVIDLIKKRSTLEQSKEVYNNGK
jgi:hypothetical protein